MTSDPAPQHPLAQALRVCARGIYPDEAAVELIIGHGAFLHRGDFTQHITIGEYGPYCILRLARAGVPLGGEPVCRCR